MSPMMLLTNTLMPHPHPHQQQQQQQQHQHWLQMGHNCHQDMAMALAFCRHSPPDSWPLCGSSELQLLLMALMVSCPAAYFFHPIPFARMDCRSNRSKMALRHDGLERQDNKSTHIQLCNWKEIKSIG